MAKVVPLRKPGAGTQGKRPAELRRLPHGQPESELPGFLKRSTAGQPEAGDSVEGDVQSIRSPGDPGEPRDWPASLWFYIGAFFGVLIAAAFMGD